MNRILLTLACCAPLLLLPACGEDAEYEARFEADYTDDYENDAAEARAQASEQALLDTLDDLDEVPQPGDDDDLVAAASARPPHGPLSIIEDDPHFSDPSGAALSDARALGADVVRVMLSWQSVVPGGDTESTEKPPFNAYSPRSYRWESFDRRVKGALDRGMSVLITLAAPMPFWASEEPQVCARMRADDLKKPPAERRFWSCSWRPDVKEYAKFVTAVGRHVREQGWARRLLGFTLWNEPNINGFLMDGTAQEVSGDKPPSIAVSRYLTSLRYRKLWFAGRKALRATAGVRARVFFGDGANDLVNPGDEAGCPRLCAATPDDASCQTCGAADEDLTSTRWAFLRYALCLDPGDGKLLAERLLSKCPEAPRRIETSGVAFHPYAPRPSVAQQSVSILQRLVDGAAQRDRLPRARGLYMTEAAYLTQKGDGGLGATRPVTLVQQAVYGNLTDHAMYANRRVRSVAQYELYDEGRAGWESGLRYSDSPAPAAAYLDVLRPQLGGVDPASLRGQPKPAYAAYRLAIAVSSADAGQASVFGLDRRLAQGGALLVQASISGLWMPVATIGTDALGYGEALIAADTAGMARAYRLCSGGQTVSRCVAANPADCAVPDPTGCDGGAR